MSVEETEAFRINKGVELTSEIEGFEGIHTIPEMLEACVAKYKDQVLYRYRKVTKQHIEWDLASNRKLITYEHGPEQTLTYNQFMGMVKAASFGLRKFTGLKKGDKVGIYLNTSLEWALSFHAILRSGFVVTTVYATLGWDNLIESLNESEITAMVCAADNVQNIDKHLGGGVCQKLKKLIVVGDVHYKSEFFEMTPIYSLIEDGYKNPLEELAMPKRDDLAILMYTSGTTGTPKGVMMRQDNMIATVGGFIKRLKFCSDDTHLSYLPFAHIFELSVHNALVFAGGKIVFAGVRTLFAKPGGAKKVGDITFAKPTIFCGVPKVWSTLCKAISAQVRMKSKMEQFMFNMVLTEKMKQLKTGVNEKIKFAAAGGLPLEDVVFAKIRLMFGGNLRVLISGGAPLNPENQYFLASVLGPNVSVVQGYGLTETCASTTIQPLNEDMKSFTVSNVGIPTCSVEIKIQSAPDMNYSCKQKYPEGELLVRGPPLSYGYFKKKKLSDEAFEKDGWFHTGDIVRFNVDEQTISVIDRKKNLVKLSHGEYVAVEGLEVAYGLSNFVAASGVYVHVDPLKSHVVAIVLPDQIFMKQFAAKNNLKLETLITNKSFLKSMEQDFMKIAETEKLKKYELLDSTRFVVKNDMWLPNNGMLTAASKLKRRALRKKYENEINEMYGLKKKEEEVVIKKKSGGSETEGSIPDFVANLRPNFM